MKINSPVHVHVQDDQEVLVNAEGYRLSLGSTPIEYLMAVDGDIDLTGSGLKLAAPELGYVQPRLVEFNGVIYGVGQIQVDGAGNSSWGDILLPDECLPYVSDQTFLLHAQSTAIVAGEIYIPTPGQPALYLFTKDGSNLADEAFIDFSGIRYLKA